MSLHSAISSRYKTYPDYKDSGVERLGLIPEPWKSVRLKHVLKIRNGRDYKEVEVESGGYPVYGSGGIFKRSSKYLFDGKSVLFGRKGTIDRPLLVSGRFWTVDTMFYSEIYDKAIPEYIYYQSLFFPFDLLTTNTALPSMTQEDLLELDFILPPKAEQRQIINFLDHETAKIDTLIEKQQRLIELLIEKRQAVISQAVTKGLNPDVPMKDSGVEWLGDVPEHWDINKLRYKFDFGSGLNITKANLKETGVPCINYGEIHSKYGFEVNTDVHQLKCVDELYLKARPGALLNQGDFIFADTSEDIEGAGNFTQLVSCSSAFAGYHTVIARPKDKFGIRFYAYLLDSVPLRTQIRTSVKGVKVFSITQSILKSINIWIPPLNEREEIAEYLDEQTYKIDALIAKANQQIQLMQERRTALISAAVTGKIDVRDWVKPE